MENPNENLSPEELEQRKEEMKTFYDQSIPYLESQLKYEELLTNVEEARFKRANFQYQWQMLMAQTQMSEDESEDQEKSVNKSTSNKSTKKKLKRT
mgnify:CR=1 FL=1|tara:strand:- start:247 stop:534 length:288 start_codon:yes stop_codon:yes gene_type:complete